MALASRSVKEMNPEAPRKIFHGERQCLKHAPTAAPHLWRVHERGHEYLPRHVGAQVNRRQLVERVLHVTGNACSTERCTASEKGGEKWDVGGIRRALRGCRV